MHKLTFGHANVRDTVFALNMIYDQVFPGVSIIAFGLCQALFHCFVGDNCCAYIVTGIDFWNLYCKRKQGRNRELFSL